MLFVGGRQTKQKTQQAFDNEEWVALHEQQKSRYSTAAAAAASVFDSVTFRAKVPQMVAFEKKCVLCFVYLCEALSLPYVTQYTTQPPGQTDFEKLFDNLYSTPSRVSKVSGRVRVGKVLSRVFSKIHRSI